MSSSTPCRSPDLKAPMFITMSISEAPSATACLVSAAFTSVVVAPSGKPTTVHTWTLGFLQLFRRPRTPTRD